MRSVWTSTGSEGIGVEVGVGVGVDAAGSTLTTPVMEGWASQANVYLPAAVNVRAWPSSTPSPYLDGNWGYAGPSAKWKLWKFLALGLMVKVTVSPTWIVTSSGSKKRVNGLRGSRRRRRPARA